jgi:flagellar L-ring protein FlgH
MHRAALIALAAAGASCSTTRATLNQFGDDTAHVAGSAVDAARRLAGPPQLAPVNSPAELVGPTPVSMPQPQLISQTETAPNSLWRAGEHSFFNDQRATQIGDILRVKIEIADKAELSNSSDRKRSSSTSAGVSHFFGLENGLGRLFGADFDPTNLVGASGDTDQSGEGAINREEKIELTVAAAIVDRLPNGNLVIAGRQQVRINAELRELTVSGVIRPQDIASDNSIRHDQIAEARISYGGRGQLSAAQRPRWGQRVADAIAPW